MRFEDFIEQGKVRKGTPDIPKLKSLLETSNNHMLFLKNQITITMTRMIPIIPAKISPFSMPNKAIS